MRENLRMWPTGPILSPSGNTIDGSREAQVKAQPEPPKSEERTCGTKQPTERRSEIGDRRSKNRKRSDKAPHPDTLGCASDRHRARLDGADRTTG